MDMGLKLEGSSSFPDLNNGIALSVLNRLG